MSLGADEEAETLLAASADLHDEVSHKIQKVQDGTSVAEHLRARMRNSSIQPNNFSFSGVNSVNSNQINPQVAQGLPFQSQSQGLPFQSQSQGLPFQSQFQGLPFQSQSQGFPFQCTPSMFQNPSMNFSQYLTVGEAGLSIEDLKYRYKNLDRQGRLDELTWESLCYIPLAVLAQKELEATEKMFTQTKTMEDRLEKNRDIVLQDVVYKEETDDLQLRLHPVRFCRMPITNSQRLFQMARDVIGPGITPITAYSFDHLRHSHRISTTAFVESHNLVSQKVQLF